MDDAQTSAGNLAAQAQAALDADDINTARALLQPALAKDPRNVMLLRLAARTAQAGGETAMAFSLLQTALRISANDRDTIAALFALCVSEQDVSTAAKLLNRDRAVSGDDGHHLLMRTQLHLASGEETKAQAVLDRLLTSEPEHHKALEIRARLAMRRGQPEALKLYQKVRHKHGQNVAILRDHARAYANQGDYDSALELLDDAGAAYGDTPQLIVDRLALLQEAGRIEAQQAAIEQAKVAAKEDSATRIMLADLLMQQDRPEDALDLLVRQRQASDGADARLTEARAAGMAGQVDHADSVLQDLQQTGYPIPPLILVRHHIRQRRFAAAETLLNTLVQNDPANIGAWALLDCVWRVTEQHSKHQWLHPTGTVIADLDLGLAADAISEAAQWLRTQHHAAAAPTGQSLRHGTQTGGAILAYDQEMAGQLRCCISKAIAQYIAALPDTDTRHPLLRFRRNIWCFQGSWSVRLNGGGHHKSHIHPGGHISSASYWALPKSDAADNRSGALELGRSPEDLRLNLPPLKTITPQTGHLILFPSSLYHGTRRFTNGERLTLAFDATFLA